MNETPEIPLAISTEQLQAVLDKVHEDASDDKKWDKDSLEALAIEILEELKERCEDPMALKVLILLGLNAFIRYHQHVAENLCKEYGMNEQVQSWFCDAGILQAAGSLITQVGIGDDDFLCPHND